LQCNEKYFKIPQLRTINLLNKHKLTIAAQTCFPVSIENTDFACKKTFGLKNLLIIMILLLLWLCFLSKLFNILWYINN